MENLLEVRNLKIAFSRKADAPEVVSGVSFSVARGEVLALVGESGCGKSASCLAFSGLLPVPPARVSGDGVFFTDSDGRKVDLLSLPEKELRKLRGGKIAYIFQEPSASLNPVMRVGAQIAEVIKLHRPEVTEVRREVITLLKDVGIPAPESRCDAYPHELSGGMQQRVMIAMALAGEPELLIADEPTTALDVTVQSQILDLLGTLRRTRKMTVILISHNLGVVSGLADNVAVMYAGNVVEYGSVRQILSAPAHPYTKALLAAVPVLGRECGELCTSPGFVPAPEDFPAGCRFCNRCSLTAALPPEKVERCRRERPELKTLPSGQQCACFAVGE